MYIQRIDTSSTTIYTKCVQWNIRYSEEKDILLKHTRKVSFGGVIDAIKTGKILAELTGRNYLGQRVLVVELDGRAHAVPYVIDHKTRELILKTLYPSRALTKRYTKLA